MYWRFCRVFWQGGGGDFPEDVLGGLAKAVQLPWSEHGGTRIIFHIGDAPPHGARFAPPPGTHSSGYDEYPSGHPSDPSLATLFGDMQRLETMYYFGKVNSACDKMIEVFSTPHGRTVDTFDMTDVKDLTESVTNSVMEVCG